MERAHFSTDPEKLASPNIPYDEVVLERLPLRIKQVFSKVALDHMSHRMVIENELVMRAQELVYVLRLDVARRVCHETWYPKTWWDHFKFRWFPAWALRRWPMDTVRISIDELYTNVAIPEHARYVRFLVNKDEGDGWKIVQPS